MYDMELNWAGRPPSNAPEMFMAHNQPWTTDVDPGVTEDRVNQSETHWTGDIKKEQQHYKIRKCENLYLTIWGSSYRDITYDDQIMI